MSVMSQHHCAPTPKRAAVATWSKPVEELVLSGDLDMANAEELDCCLTEAIGRRSDIVVDLTAVWMIDCVCLGVLVRAAHTAKALHCALSLVAPSPLVRMTMRYTATDSVFSIYANRASALRRSHVMAITPVVGGPT